MSTSSQLGTPATIVIGSSRPSSARRFNLRSQSGSRATSSGGKTYGRRREFKSLAAIPLRSPCSTPGAGRSRSLEPPRKNSRPWKSRESGRAAMWAASMVLPAFVFEASISRETGMYFVAPCVVPLVMRYG